MAMELLRAVGGAAAVAIAVSWVGCSYDLDALRNPRDAGSDCGAGCRTDASGMDAGGGVDAGAGFGGPTCDAGSVFYRDVDDDGYGDPNDSLLGCEAPEGYVDNSNDCFDGDQLIRPGAVESCDQRDQDCDGATDEGFIGFVGDRSQLVTDTPAFIQSDFDVRGSVPYRTGYLVVFEARLIFGGPHRVHLLELGADGAPNDGAAFVPFELGDPGHAQRGPRATRVLDGDGVDHAVIAWREGSAVGASSEICIAGTVAGGLGFSSPVVLGTTSGPTTGGGDQLLGLAVVDGLVVVVWAEGNALVARRYDPITNAAVGAEARAAFGGDVWVTSSIAVASDPPSVLVAMGRADTSAPFESASSIVRLEVGATFAWDDGAPLDIPRVASVLLPRSWDPVPPGDVTFVTTHAAPDTIDWFGPALYQQADSCARTLVPLETGPPSLGPCIDLPGVAAGLPVRRGAVVSTVTWDQAEAGEMLHLHELVASGSSRVVAFEPDPVPCFCRPAPGAVENRLALVRIFRRLRGEHLGGVPVIDIANLTPVEQAQLAASRISVPTSEVQLRAEIDRLLRELSGVSGLSFRSGGGLLFGNEHSDIEGIPELVARTIGCL